jgi:hypothetical protein
MRAGFVGTSARVVDAVFKQDLALLEVTGQRTALLAEIESKTGSKTMYRRETYRDPARLSSTKLREGVALAVSGYPLAEPSLVTNAGILATTFSVAGGREGYLGDFTVNPGNSGGPVYTVGNAEVIGVCAAIKRRSYLAGLTLIVPVDQVRAMLAWRRTSRLKRSRSASAAGSAGAAVSPSDAGRDFQVCARDGAQPQEAPWRESRPSCTLEKGCHTWRRARPRVRQSRRRSRPLCTASRPPATHRAWTGRDGDELLFGRTATEPFTGS